MAMRIYLAVICAVSLLVFPMTATAQKKGEFVRSETFAIAAPEGLVTFRRDTITDISGKRLSLVLNDANGRKLVGGKYFSIDPINGRQALVATKIPGQGNPALNFSLIFRLHTFGKGEGPVLDYRHVTYVGDQVRRYYAYNAARVTLFGAKGERVFDVPGGLPTVTFPLRTRGDMILLAFMGDGVEHGRVLTPDGDFISPSMGAISIVKTYAGSRFADGPFVGDPVLSSDVMTIAIDAFEAPGWGTIPLYVPIDESGAPLSLPPGVIGISPVVPATTWTHQRATRIWSVLFQEPSGQVTGAILPGALTDVLRMAPTAQRFRTWDFQPGAKLVHAQQMDGSWIVLHGGSGLPILYPNMKTGGYGSRTALHAAYSIGREAEVAEIYARSAAELAAYQAEARRKAVERYARRRAEGYPCAPGVINDAFAGGRDTASQFLQECPGQIDAAAYGEARRLGASPAAFAAVDAYWLKQEKIRRERIASEAVILARAPAPGSTGSTNYSNAATQQWNNYVARTNATSQRNFNAYMSGAQKWCC